MATSGTVGTTTLNVMQVIEDAVRKCKVPVTLISPEVAQIAKRNLFYFMSSLVNRGQLLWAIDPVIIGLIPGQLRYDLPLGTVDVLANNTNYATTTPMTGTATSDAGGTAANAFDQDISTYCTQTSADGSLTLQPSSAAYLNMVGLMSRVTRTYDLVWEWSADGIAWNELYSPGALEYPARQWVYRYVPTPRSASWFRVREQGGAVLDVIEVAMVSSWTNVPIPSISRDNYSNLPNPTFQQRQVTQYYFKRLRTTPPLLTWPVPTNFMDILTLQRSRQLEDVGQLTDELEIPQRWNETLTWQAAARMCPDLQSVPGLPRADGAYMAYLQQMADKFEREAFDEERDDGPVYYAPNISVYTA